METETAQQHKYRLTYSIDAHPEGIAREDLPKGKGACDAVLLMSIIYPPDGSLSVLVVTKDGREDREMTDQELFKFWTLLTSRVARGEINGWQKQVAQRCWQIIVTAMNKINNA